MVDPIDTDVFLHIVATPGLDGNGISAPDALALRNDVNTILARPVILKLDDIPDVDLTGLADGEILAWDTSSSTWKAIPAATVAVADSASVDLTLAAGTITAVVVFAGTGSAGTAARSDHTHTVASGSSTPFNATGYMSSSSRTLVTTTRVLNAGIEYLVKATLKPQMRGADAGPAYFTMTTTINGNARTSPGGATSGFWAVQGVPNKESWSHYQTIVGTGAAITISGSVAYHSGAGFNVDAGEIEIELIPRR